ncbi:MAG: molybdenum cofactor sulfurase [Rhizobiaceae bacterium]
MIDPFANHREEITIHPMQKIKGRVKGLYQAQGRNFVTAPVDEMQLTYDGIPGDFHGGATRNSGGREPWYARETEMRNERQLSLLAPDELTLVAQRLDIPELKPEWIGGNLLLEGIENLTMLPPRTLLFFENGVTIKIDGDNAPCRPSGRSIAEQFEGRDDIELEFVKQAQQLRGLVAWVEKPGVISIGESFEARVHPQWIYTASS